MQALAGLAKEDLIEEMELEPGTTVKEVASRLPLKNTAYLVFLLNDQKVEENTKLQEGDSLVIFPPVLGG